MACSALLARDDRGAGEGGVDPLDELQRGTVKVFTHPLHDRAGFVTGQEAPLAGGSAAASAGSLHELLLSGSATYPNGFIEPVSTGTTSSPGVTPAAGVLVTALACSPAASRPVAT
jgi:hypothetical protein